MRRQLSTDFSEGGEEPKQYDFVRLPVWVKVRPQLANDRCLFALQQQTLIRATAWSASCQFRKWPGSPCGGLLCRDVLLRDDCDDPAHWCAGCNLPHRADQSRHQRALDRQRRSFVPILGVPATTRQSLISCLERFHASPMVAVRDTSPRRTKDISETLNKNVPPLHVG